LFKCAHTRVQQGQRPGGWVGGCLRVCMRACNMAIAQVGRRVCRCACERVQQGQRPGGWVGVSVRARVYNRVYGQLYVKVCLCWRLGHCPVGCLRVCLCSTNSHSLGVCCVRASAGFVRLKGCSPCVM